MYDLGSFRLQSFEKGHGGYKSYSRLLQVIVIGDFDAHQSSHPVSTRH